ncbi:MAG: type II secretion system F family protein [Fimbriimonadales bacterium]|nr:type II secretion system F family protein [Fimbriimonadales bacterium]
MPTKTFTYVAVDPNGTRLTGLVEADSLGQARDRLIKLGYRVHSLQEGIVQVGRDRPLLVKGVLAPLFGRVNYETLLNFFTQLGAMHRAGVLLVRSLETLGSQTMHPKMRKVIRDMRATVLEGRPLSEAMEKYPEVFSPLQVNLIWVGEQGGMLDRSLHYICEYLEHEIELRNLIKATTFYPKLVIALSIIIVLVTNWLVELISAKMGGPALFIYNPLTDPRVLIWLLPGLVLLFLFLRIGLQHSRIHLAWDWFLLRLPYLGTTLRMLAMAKFGRAFSALYSGAVPISQAILLAADSCGNEYIRWRIHPSVISIQEGKGIAESLAKTGVFTKMALDMCATGEETGNLEAMCRHVADLYESEARVRVKKTAHVFSVAVLIAIAILVAYIVLSFYMGYIQLVLSSMGEG